MLEKIFCIKRASIGAEQATYFDLAAFLAIIPHFFIGTMVGGMTSVGADSVSFFAFKDTPTQQLT